MKNITLVIDIPDWAYDHIADNIIKYLGQHYSFHKLYVIDYKNKLEDLWYEIIAKKSDYCFFFWRSQLDALVNPKVLIALFDKYSLDPDELMNFLNTTGFFSSVYDHLIVDDDFKLESYRNFFNNYIDDYYVSSEKLYAIYEQIPDFKPPMMIIQDGVDIQVFSPNSHSPSNNNSLVLGWAGNSQWRMEQDGIDHKGVETIIKPAIQDLQNSSYAVELKMADSSTNKIPFEQMPEFYRSLDVYLCTSDIEGTPNPVLEAMSTGLPVISTDVGIVPEAVGKIQSEFILKERSVKCLKEFLIRLINNPDERIALAKENLQSIKSWSWEAQAQKFLKFFNQAIENFEGLSDDQKMARFYRMQSDILTKLATYSISLKNDHNSLKVRVQTQQKKILNVNKTFQNLNDKIQQLEINNQTLTQRYPILNNTKTIPVQKARINFRTSNIFSIAVKATYNLFYQLKMFKMNRIIKRIGFNIYYIDYKTNSEKQ